MSGNDHRYPTTRPPGSGLGHSICNVRFLASSFVCFIHLHCSDPTFSRAPGFLHWAAEKDNQCHPQSRDSPPGAFQSGTTELHVTAAGQYSGIVTQSPPAARSSFQSAGDGYSDPNRKKIKIPSDCLSLGPLCSSLWKGSRAFKCLDKRWQHLVIV